MRNGVTTVKIGFTIDVLGYFFESSLRKNEGETGSKVPFDTLARVEEHLLPVMTLIGEVLAKLRNMLSDVLDS